MNTVLKSVEGSNVEPTTAQAWGIAARHVILLWIMKHDLPS